MKRQWWGQGGIELYLDGVGDSARATEAGMKVGEEMEVEERGG